MDFLKTCLSEFNGEKDEEGPQKKNELWVRNQAMQQFGQIIHAVH